MSLLTNEGIARSIERFLVRPSHGLLITGPKGVGKSSIAKYIAGELLGVSVDALDGNPYIKIVNAASNKNISVADVRTISRFLTLRVAGGGPFDRIVIIEDANTMTLQAQSSLLKTLEEPPEGTVLILTAQSDRSVLPTIRSRVQVMQMSAPKYEDSRKYFMAFGYKPAAIEKALLMSGGLPGLMKTLLEDETNNPLHEATRVAREVLQKTTFERIIMTEEIAKQRQLWSDALFILSQMAETALSQSRGGVTAQRRWHKVLSAVHAAGQQTTANAQIKLVVLNFMLSL